VRDLFRLGAIVLLQYEVTSELLQYTLDLAHAAGCRTMFNLAPPRPFPEPYLKKVDILVVNETEASFQCGFPVETEAQAWRAAEALLARGVGMVILTLGAQGCLAAYPEAGRPVRQHVPAFKVQAVDTTAAGDVFCGTLAAALMEGQPVPAALRFASAAAAICVTRIGAQPSIPTRLEIDAFLARA
jgi:ribokinase